jgi:hypothetical protein
MQESEAHGVPTWLLVVLAVVVPLILATLFGGVLNWSNRASECAQWNTVACLTLAARNDRIVLLHGLAQSIFVLLGGWHLGRSTKARVAVLLISIPWSGVVFFFWYFGAMAG